MDLFTKTKAVKLRSHHNKYLVADDDKETVRQSRNSSSRKSRWLVEPVHGGCAIRLKSCHGLYLTASNGAFLLGMTGNKVLQSEPELDSPKDLFIEWRPIRVGSKLELRSFGGTCLRANGGPPPWRNSVTHDNPSTNSTRNWILWYVVEVEVPEDESFRDYLSMMSSFSSVSEKILSELGSPVSVRSSSSSSRLAIKKAGMDLFQNAKAVRLRSHHGKYLNAEEDEESVSQNRDGFSKNARWTVEFVGGADHIIRLKSCYGKYLTASNMPFLLGMTGNKVLQTLPTRLDAPVEWEPIREGNQMKLRTRYGQFLRANGGIPPWRNSVTHDIPHRTATQDWILWDVHVVEILLHSPHPKSLPLPPSQPAVVNSESSSPSTRSTKSSRLSGRESSDSQVSSPPKAADGRTIYYHVADELGNVEEGAEELRVAFKGNGVNELTRKLEEETGLEEIIVCSWNPLNGKLFPLMLQLPARSVTMHVVVVQSESKVAKDFAKAGILLS